MVQLLMSSKNKRQVSFENTVMIGRQNMHMNKTQLEACFKTFNYTNVEIDEVYPNPNCYAEPLLKALGAKQTDSLDASSYENATIVHDMNEPIDSSLYNKYDVVLDSGTLEHVFNFPTAIKNCMQLTKDGGHFIGIYPANNFFGHGFYQFSSELFYRTFTPENGFEICDVILFVDESNTTFYSVPDTSEKFHRINYTNSKPVLMYILAKKTSTTNILLKNPLQMDYSQMKWKGKPVKKQFNTKKKAKAVLPPYIKNIIKALINKKPANDSINFRKPFFTKYQL